MKYCNNCTSENGDEAVYCYKCGNKIESTASQMIEHSVILNHEPNRAKALGKSKFVVGVIAIFIIALLSGGWYIKNRNETSKYCAELSGFIETTSSLYGELGRLEPIGSGYRQVLRVSQIKEELKKAREKMLSIPTPNSDCVEIKRTANLFIDASLVYCDNIIANIEKLRTLRTEEGHKKDIYAEFKMKNQTQAGELLMQLKDMLIKQNDDMQKNTTTLTPEEWLKANQDVLDNLMQNQIRLGSGNQHYLYLVNSGDVRVFKKIFDTAQSTRQKLSYKCTNEDTENLRLLIDKELSRQIEIAEYTKASVLSKKATSDYENGLKKQASQGILNNEAPLEKLLRKYKISIDDLFKKAFKVVDNERY